MLKKFQHFFLHSPWKLVTVGARRARRPAGRQHYGGATVPRPRTCGISDPEAGTAPHGHGGPRSTAPRSCACAASSRGCHGDATLHVLHRGHGGAPPRLCPRRAKGGGASTGGAREQVGGKGAWGHAGRRRWHTRRRVGPTRGRRRQQRNGNEEEEEVVGFECWWALVGCVGFIVC
jgi:hypothetical protein